jgi:hypothetical protein
MLFEEPTLFKNTSFLKLTVFTAHAFNQDQNYPLRELKSSHTSSANELESTMVILVKSMILEPNS